MAVHDMTMPTPTIQRERVVEKIASLSTSHVLHDVLVMLDLRDLTRSMHTCREWSHCVFTYWRSQQQILLRRLPVLKQETDDVRSRLRPHLEQLPRSEEWLSGLKVHSALVFHDDLCHGWVDEATALLSLKIPADARSQSSTSRAVPSLWKGGSILLMKWVYMRSHGRMAPGPPMRARMGPAMLVYPLGVTDASFSQSFGFHGNGMREASMRFHSTGDSWPPPLQWPVEIASESSLQAPQGLTEQEELELQRLTEIVGSFWAECFGRSRTERLFIDEESKRLEELQEYKKKVDTNRIRHQQRQRLSTMSHPNVPLIAGRLCEVMRNSLEAQQTDSCVFSDLAQPAETAESSSHDAAVLFKESGWEGDLSLSRKEFRDLYTARVQRWVQQCDVHLCPHPWHSFSSTLSWRHGV